MGNKAVRLPFIFDDKSKKPFADKYSTFTE